NLGLEYGDTSHQNSGGFLVERVSDRGISCWSAQVTSNCGDLQVELTGRVLVICEELNESLLRSLLMLWTGLCSNLKVCSNRGRWINSTNLPCASVTDANLCYSDRG